MKEVFGEFDKKDIQKVTNNSIQIHKDIMDKNLASPSTFFSFINTYKKLYNFKVNSRGSES